MADLAVSRSNSKERWNLNEQERQIVADERSH